MTQSPALLLFPNLLGEHRHHEIFLPASVDKAVGTIDGLIAESEHSGRRFLGRFETKKPCREIPIALLNENASPDTIEFLLEPMMKGERWGLISDAGLPCVADPGHELVHRARQVGIVVQAFVGPSSIMMSLMLSGMPGQNFAFHGYLDRVPEERRKEIAKLEKRAKVDDETQIFIETPYRNNFLLKDLLDILHNETSLCVAWDLTLPTQGILSQTIEIWKKSPVPNLGKKCATFLMAHHTKKF